MKNATPHDHASIVFNYVITALITINVAVVILETVPELATLYEHTFVVIDTIIAVVFTLEYFARLWSCTALHQYKHPVWGRIKFAFTPLALIDLAAITPFYAPLFFVFNIDALRTLRLFRLIRTLKIYRYSDGLQAFVRVIRLKKRQLGASLLVLAIGLLFSSTLLYYVEREAQPEHFGSIPASLWWASITLSTVGYGDVIPITPLGRLFGALIALLGIGIFAIPAGILASGYMRMSQKLLQKNKRQGLKRNFSRR